MIFTLKTSKLQILKCKPQTTFSFKCKSKMCCSYSWILTLMNWLMVFHLQMKMPSGAILMSYVMGSLRISTKKPSDLWYLQTLNIMWWISNSSHKIKKPNILQTIHKSLFPKMITLSYLLSAIWVQKTHKMVTQE